MTSPCGIGQKSTQEACHKAALTLPALIAARGRKEASRAARIQPIVAFLRRRNGILAAGYSPSYFEYPRSFQ
jgi:hypothetical protein